MGKEPAGNGHQPERCCVNGADDHPWNNLGRATSPPDPFAVTGDPYWLSERGLELSREASEAAEIAEAARVAELAAKEAAKAETQAELAAEIERARETASAALKAQRKAEQAEDEARAQRKRDAECTRLAALDAERSASAAALTAASVALARQDRDFHAFSISMIFYIDGRGNADSATAPAQWVLSDDEYENAAIVAQVGLEVMHAISPWLEHYAAIGLIRADGLTGTLTRDLVVAGHEPTFYLVCHSADAEVGMENLGELPPITIPIDALPGASLVITSRVEPINATLLVGALRECVEPIGPWGGRSGVVGLPVAAEKRKAFLGRVAVARESTLRLIERWRSCGGDLELFGMLGSAAERASGNQKIEWLVERRIPRGYVTLLVGNNASGKSSAAHEIAAALGSPDALAPRIVLGTEIVGHYEVALISGEDGEDIINHRADAHATIWGRHSYFVMDGVAERLENLLSAIDRTPHLDLLIIDPVRAFLEGDEDSSAVVSKFYDRFTRIARDKNCAVLAVHHLTKGRPRRLSDMLPMVRGSGVHSDRPRLVVGMIYRGNGIVEIGPIKGNLPGLWAAIGEGELYTRDAATFTLKPVIAAGAEPSSTTERENDGARVLAAVADRNRAGVVLRKTGKSGLYEARLPALAGMSRSAILVALASLIEAAQLTDAGECGLLVAESTGAGKSSSLPADTLPLPAEGI